MPIEIRPSGLTVGHTPGLTQLYLLFSTGGTQVWQTTTSTFVAYNPANLANYRLTMSEGLPGCYAYGSAPFDEGEYLATVYEDTSCTTLVAHSAVTWRATLDQDGLLTGAEIWQSPGRSQLLSDISNTLGVRLLKDPRKTINNGPPPEFPSVPPPGWRNFIGRHGR